ncbi:MBL fold metallo-hydrolase [Halococcoides cellulosivorans]|uniref:MBL fold metallo-hydrolase n=1 Tax=Halococcoides cellulosivorans TaxID=1679096 RepID=A0A2R4WYG3_9EURY|nr:MBL fold metallo-hydrolase [Halococcoides cellulosivorans]AWB26568.1 MBL fold metallo-hydrolase [Halococcoides cellulosivorans]
MAIGELTHADRVDPDLAFVDSGMFDCPEYGSIYLIDDDRPAIVDTGIGTGVDRILDACETVGIAPADLAVIALTHVHLDHAGGAGHLIERCPDAKVYVHEIGAPHVEDPERLWEGTKRAVGDQIAFYRTPQAVDPDRIVEITDGETIDLGAHRLVAHHAPGHAPHQVVYEAPTMDAVFTGDAAGVYAPSTDAVYPTSPPPDFDHEQVLADTHTIEDLGREWICYAHFGPAKRADRLATYREAVDRWVDQITTWRAEMGDEQVVERAIETRDRPDVWPAHKARGEVAMNARGVLHFLDQRA